MTSISGIAGAGTATETPERERLQSAMRQLEAVFVQQLFKAMRETVPDESGSRGAGEETFTALLDEKLAESVPGAWEGNGLEAALMRQFRSVLPAEEPSKPLAAK
jgi:flagellar protein FlgJ